MSVQDRDIERALATLADGIDLEDRDVEAAFGAFVDRSQRASRRRRRQRLVAACAAAALLVGGAAAFWAQAKGKDRLLPARPTTTRTSVISASDLVGVWAMNAPSIAESGSLWTFYADGSGGYTNNANILEVRFLYSLSPSGLGLHDASGCAFSYHLTGYTRGVLTVKINDHCGNTGPDFAFVRLSPATPTGTGILMPAMTGAHPVNRIAQVGGVWLMPGTGTLLAIDASKPSHATYALDDRGNLARNPRDTGVVTVSADGTLTLTSSQPAPAGCSDPQGSRITLRGVTILPGKGLEAAGGPASTCPRARVQAKWIMVSAR